MRLIREVRSFYSAKAKAGAWDTIILASGLALAALAGAVLLLLMPFVEKVGADEIVVCETSSGGEKDVTVWNGAKDPGFHWQGMCKITTYRRTGSGSFSETMVVDGRRFAVQGSASYELKLSDEEMLAHHRDYGSERELFDRTVLNQVRVVLEEAAGHPSWAAPKGGFVERKLKGALEYGLERFKLSDGFMSTAEARQGLQKEMNQRLTKLGAYSEKTPVTVTIRSIKER